MKESQRIEGLRYQRGYWGGYWEGRLIGGNGNIIRYSEPISDGTENDGTEIVLLKENKSHRSGFWHTREEEMAESRSATPAEILLLVESVPLALRQVRDNVSLRMLGNADLREAQFLTERLMEEAGKKLELEDQVKRLSQVRDSLAAEGLIYKSGQV